MNDKTRFVFRGWLQLSPQERSDLIGAIQEFAAGEPGERTAFLRESAEFITKRISLGPLSDACTCCGK